jgi:catalase
MTAPENMGGYVHHAEKVEGHKIRERSESFKDFYSQATLFWNSLSEPEKEHLVEAAHFELGKVETIEIRQRMVDHFNHIDHQLATRVAQGIGVTPPEREVQPNHGRKSAAVSMENTIKNTIQSRKVAVLVAPGYNYNELMDVKKALKNAGATAEVVSKFGGKVLSADGQETPVDKMFVTTASVMYDAIYVPGGKQSVDTLKQQGDAIHFINEAFRHCKAIAASSEGVELFQHASLEGVRLAAGGDQVLNDRGVVTIGKASQAFTQQFIDAIAQHRHWERAQKEQVPA